MPPVVRAMGLGRGRAGRSGLRRDRRNLAERAGLEPLFIAPWQLGDIAVPHGGSADAPLVSVEAQIEVPELDAGLLVMRVAIVGGQLHFTIHFTTARSG